MTRTVRLAATDLLLDSSMFSALEESEDTHRANGVSKLPLADN